MNRIQNEIERKRGNPPVRSSENDLGSRPQQIHDHMASHPLHKLGNQVIQQMAKSCPVFPSRCPFGGTCHACPVQAKLTVNKPGDKYEQEADRVTDQVMRMPDPGIQRYVKPLMDQITPPIQRQVEPEDEEERVIQGKAIGGANVQRQEEDPEEEELQHRPKEEVKKASLPKMEGTVTRPGLSQLGLHWDTRYDKWLVSKGFYEIGGYSGSISEQDIVPESEEEFTIMFLTSQYEHPDGRKAQIETEFWPNRLEEQLTIYKKNWVTILHREKLVTPRAAVDELYMSKGSGALLDLIQPKLKIGSANDKYEQEADRVAEQVMQMPEPQLQRQSEEEEEELLQAKELRGYEPCSASGLVASIQTVRNGGQPLPRSVRNYFEPRFGVDFSQVRIHTGTHAAATARALNSRAFTMGRDVVFGAGQYAPDAGEGRRLLAHELTHVVQQRITASPMTLKRWSYGTGSPPHAKFIVVPKKDKPRVEAGMRIVNRVVSNPKKYPRCHKQFQSLCPSPSAHELIDRFNATKLWKQTDDKDPFYYGSSVPPDHISYSHRTWRIGRWMIANTAIHEFMHRCGFHTEADINKAAVICGMPKKPY